MNDFYKKSESSLWQGRTDNEPNYWHQIIQCVDISKEKLSPEKAARRKFALLGYCCDEGVSRNQGRPGAAKGPDACRKMLGSLPNHFPDDIILIDAGNIHYMNDDLIKTHETLSTHVAGLLEKNFFPLLIGGGHDIAYAHYSGIREYIGSKKKMGIINLDAHFDLRPDGNGRNSGTPFYQIAQDCKASNTAFNYLCLGIQRQSNTRTLFKLADELGVQYVESQDFVMRNWEKIEARLTAFLKQCDHIYLTIDLDGFASAYAPGVSAPSPFGFQPDVAREVIRLLCNSGKLISVDVAELNPNTDLDNCTARLAAKLIGFITDTLSA